MIFQGSTSVIEYDPTKQLVTKRVHQPFRFLFEQEVRALKLINKYLKKNDIFPILHSINEKNCEIVTNFCGERVCKETVPENWEFQIERIAAILDRFKILHFDITPQNIVVDGNKLKLIDFGKAKIQKHYYQSKLNRHTRIEAEYSLSDWQDVFVVYDIDEPKTHTLLSREEYYLVVNTYKKPYDNLMNFRLSFKEIFGDFGI